MRRKSRCTHLFVRQEVCSVRLGRGKYHHSKDLGSTARDEIAIGEYDVKGRLIAFQLLGRGKPCQNSIAVICEEDESGKLISRPPTRPEIREHAARMRKLKRR